MSQTHYWSRAPFVSLCVAVAAFSFWSALMLLDQSGDPSSWSDPIVTALPAERRRPACLTFLVLRTPRFSWVRIVGINAQVIAGVPPVTGHPILRLVALADGVHTLAVRVNGLVKNERFRITAWIRPQAGANLEIAARDQADKDNGPNNARAFFDLAGRRVSSAQGNAKSGIRAGGRLADGLA